jgi:hypothetical protein
MAFLVLYLFIFFCLTASAVSSSTAASNTKPKAKAPRRERNLDHLDVETVSFYLGISPITWKPIPEAGYVGYDVAVMFYAQWDTNSHTLAPYWDNIAFKLKAGTKKSNLIMGLFNCELNYDHAQVCTAAGVKKYPTILFIGPGPFHDTDPFTRILGKDRSAGPAGAAKIPRTVKFQGNWQYTDSLRDWIRTMQGLSRWYLLTSKGPLQHIRNGILGIFRTRQLPSLASQRLPVGIPTDSQYANNAAGSASAAMVQTAILESKLKDAVASEKKMEKAATHASLLLDNILFPIKDKDPFAVLASNGGWNQTKNDDPELSVLVTCVKELSLDYCARLSTRLTENFVEEALKKSNTTKELSTISELEKQLLRKLQDTEAYCGIFDECYATKFVTATCRPETCPFQPIGCSYVTACLDDLIQVEYAKALNIIQDGDIFPPPKSSKAGQKKETKKKSTSTKKDSQKSSNNKWGFF